MWPCWSVRDAATMVDDLIPTAPMKAGNMIDPHGNTAPMYLMGYFRGEPVYRTITTNAIGIHIFLVFQFLKAS
jgi:hypothetical protein